MIFVPNNARPSITTVTEITLIAGSNQLAAANAARRRIIIALPIAGGTVLVKKGSAIVGTEFSFALVGGGAISYYVGDNFDASTSFHCTGTVGVKVQVTEET